MPVTEPLQDFLKQLQSFFVFLERPVVQRQLFVALLTLVLAYLISLVVRSRLHAKLLHLLKQRIDEAQPRWWHRLLPATANLYFPLLGLLLVQIVVPIMTSQGYVTGLVGFTSILFLILLVYRVFVTLFFTFMTTQKARFYRQRILLPLFVWIGFQILITRFLDVTQLAELELFQMLDAPVTLQMVILSILVFYVFLVLSWLFQDALLKIVMPRTTADPGVTNSVLTISRYVIIGLGIVFSASALGFNLTSLALIGGGLSIGIGFGLQQIVANFISGIVLLFEQSLRPGDVVEIQGRTGTVEKLNIRSTLIRTNDNTEYIVPNESFLTSQVMTFTKSNPLFRLGLSVGVGYGSNPKQVRDVLLATAVKHGLVKKEPSPHVFFLGFGPSSLDFELAVWIDQPVKRRRIRSDLYFMVWEALSNNNIEIPFPQHDLNLRRGWEKLAPVEEEADEEA